MSANIMDLPSMREASLAIDAVLSKLPDATERANAAVAFIVAGTMALRFYACGPVAIHHLQALVDIVEECDAEDAEGRVIQ